jgi:uncharacterized protein
MHYPNGAPAGLEMNSLEEIRDFSQIKNIPGTLDNEFDQVLRKFDSIQNIPAPLFAFLIAVLALVPEYGRWGYWAGLTGFMLLDWLLLALLTRAGRSYGPPQPSVLILALLRLPFALLPFPWNAGFQTIGTLLVIYGFWIEPHRLSITRQSLQSQKLPTSFRMKVLHLGDLHVERITRREIELTRQIQELKPDLILFSGDVLNLSYNEDPVAIEHARKVISSWQAPLGAYGVSGSEAVDLAHIFPNLVAGSPLNVLDGQTAILEHQGASFSLTGLPCSHRPYRDAPLLAELAPAATRYFSIFLYHSPDLAPDAAQMGFDLQLSGHTHGGQVCLPFVGPFFTASLYGRKFCSGRYHIKNLVLYITRGIGLEGKAAPRVRFLCPPEIILWKITGAG